MTASEIQVIYRPRHPDELSWGCAVTAWGHGLIPPGQAYPPPGHPPDHAFNWETGRTLPVFQLIYLPAGKGEFESGKTGAERVGAGDVLMLFPGIRHRYRPDPATGWEEWWVEFSGPVPDQLLKNGFLDPARPRYRVGDQPDIRRLLMELTRPPESERREFAGQRPTLTLQLLSRLQALSGEHGEPGARVSSKIQESALYIRRHHHQPVNLEKLAARMGMSYSVWRRQFKTITGFPPARFVLDCRIRSACNLLGNSHTPVTEISETCGFASPQHFSRYFRQKTGYSPREYRKRQGMDP